MLLPYFAITGFDPGDPLYNEQNPNPKAGSELGGALATIAALNAQALARKPLTANFDVLLKEDADNSKAGFARQSVNLAQAKQGTVDGLLKKYKDTTGPLYDANTAAKTVAAVSQAIQDATSAAASADNPIAGATTTGQVADK